MDPHVQLLGGRPALLGFLWADDPTFNPIKAGILEPFEIVLRRPVDDHGFPQLGPKSGSVIGGAQSSRSEATDRG